MGILCYRSKILSAHMYQRFIGYLLAWKNDFYPIFITTLTIVLSDKKQFSEIYFLRIENFKFVSKLKCIGYPTFEHPIFKKNGFYFRANIKSCSLNRIKFYVMMMLHYLTNSNNSNLSKWRGSSTTSYKTCKV